jgi:cyclase
LDIVEISQGITVFISPSGGSNIGWIVTPNGYVVVDTKTLPEQTQNCFDAANISPADVCLVFVTHSHTDHSGGISFFDCPVLTHKLTYQRILKREKTKDNPGVPTEYFEDTHDLDIGGVNFKFIHTGGHTPGSSIVWIPKAKVLFAGDLLYGGRYPILAVAHIPDLVEALRWLPTLGAECIVPGHGHICGNDEIERQLVYIETTWRRTEEHYAQGDTIEDILVDKDYPHYSELGANLHDGNIKAIYKQIKKGYSI